MAVSSDSVAASHAVSSAGLKLARAISRSVRAVSGWRTSVSIPTGCEGHHASATASPLWERLNSSAMFSKQGFPDLPKRMTIFPGEIPAAAAPELSNRHSTEKKTPPIGFLMKAAARWCSSGVRHPLQAPISHACRLMFRKQTCTRGRWAGSGVLMDYRAAELTADGDILEWKSAGTFRVPSGFDRLKFCSGMWVESRARSSSVGLKG